MIMLTYEKLVLISKDDMKLDVRISVVATED
jgi:hypothetical protein